MNIANNMEVIFVAALALASVTGLAGASRPATQPVAPALDVQSDKMQVVTISARRLTVAEKAAAQ